MANVNLRFLWARFFSLTSDQFVGSWLFCWNRKWIWVPSREPVIHQVLNCPSPRIEWKDKKCSCGKAVLTFYRNQGKVNLAQIHGDLLVSESLEHFQNWKQMHCERKKTVHKPSLHPKTDIGEERAGVFLPPASHSQSHQSEGFGRALWRSNSLTSLPEQVGQNHI